MMDVKLMKNCHLGDTNKVRGGPLGILGGGVSDPKKKFMQEIELEKKTCISLKKEKKIVQLHEIVRICVEHMCSFINK